MTIEYRRIRLTDVDALAALARSAIPDESDIAVSNEKIMSMVTFFAIHREHFQLAAFKDGVAVAGVAMLVTEMPFHERGEGTIVFCFAKEPGTGFRLLRALVDWVNNDMRIRRVSWSMNCGFDERLRTLAYRLGFKSEHPTFMFHKGSA